MDSVKQNSGSGRKLLSFVKLRLKIFLLRYFEQQFINSQRKKISGKLAKSDKLILIYSIGKVGSSTVYNSLKNSAVGNLPIFHLHTLSHEGIDSQMNYYKKSKRRSAPFHLIQSTVLNELLPKYQGETFIITLCREPISRELSSIFQDAMNFSSDYYLTQEKLVNVVQEKFKALVEHLPEEKWFKNELQGVFNIDIYSQPFEIQNGFSIFRQNNTHLALIRLENLNNVFQNVCTTLFELEGEFEIQNSNDSEEKYYADTYRQMSKEVRLKSEDIQKIVESKFVQTFYPDYIERIKQKWL